MFAQEAPTPCPYCGETITLLVDTSVLPQDYIEDCHVCCQPIEVSVTGTEDEFSLTVRTQDE